jgi:N-acetylmuramoyl-L-alanine amidase
VWTRQPATSACRPVRTPRRSLRHGAAGLHRGPGVGAAALIPGGGWPILKAVVRRIFALALIVSSISLAFADGERDILDLLEETGAELEWDDFGRTGLLWSGLDSIGFMPGERNAVVDFDQVISIEPIVYDRGQLLLPPSTYDEFATRLRAGGAVRTLRDVHAIVIDAGHGDHDGGASRTFTEGGRTVTVREKDIVLDIAIRVAEDLERMLDGPQIVLTPRHRRVP